MLKDNSSVKSKSSTNTAFMVAIFLKKGKRLFIFNETRNDPSKFPSLFAVPLVETATHESNAAILIQSKSIVENDLSSVLYNVHVIIHNQPELTELKKLYSDNALVVSPSEVILSKNEHTHKRYQELLEISMAERGTAYKLSFPQKQRMNKADKAFILVPLAKNKNKSLLLLGKLKINPTKHNFQTFILHLIHCFIHIKRKDYPNHEDYSEEAFIEAKVSVKESSIVLLTIGNEEIEYRYIPFFLDFIGELENHI